jgi:hypothetical protein
MRIAPQRILSPLRLPFRHLAERKRKWERGDSNPQPSDYESPALTIELHSQKLTVQKQEHYLVPLGEYNLHLRFRIMSILDKKGQSCKHFRKDNL